MRYELTRAYCPRGFIQSSSADPGRIFVGWRRKGTHQDFAFTCYGGHEILRVAVFRNIGSLDGPRAVSIWVFCILIHRNRRDFPVRRTGTDYVLSHRAPGVVCIFYAQSHSILVSQRLYLTLPVALPCAPLSVALTDDWASSSRTSSSPIALNPFFRLGIEVCFGRGSSS